MLWSRRITDIVAKYPYGVKRITIIGRSFGNEDFTSTKDYEGWFTTRSVSFKHVKVGYAYSNTGFTITVGATSSATLNISIGQTYYVLLRE